MERVIIEVPTFSDKKDIQNGSLASALVLKAFKNGEIIPEEDVRTKRKKEDICKHCLEYDESQKCDIENKCVLMKLFKENKRLKRKLEKLESDYLWDKSPDMMGK